MSYEAQAVFFGLAVVCFVLAGLTVALHQRISIGWIGLALAAFVWFYVAFKAADF